MADLGFLGMLVPEEWGGAQTGHLAYAMALEEIAAGDGACSTIMSVHNSVGCMPIHKFGSAEQKERFLRPLAQGSMLGAFALTEPQAGSDASFLKTRAAATATLRAERCQAVHHFGQPRGDGDRLRGHRSGCRKARHQRVHRAHRHARLRGGADRGQARPARLGHLPAGLQRPAYPGRAALGEEGEGYRIALANLEGGRIGIAAQAVGMARAAFEAARDYAHERETFGKPIIEHQAVAFRLADMATRIAVARQMVHHAASLREAGLPCLTEASMAKLFASEMAEEVCSAAIQTLGGYGYLKDFPVERIYRDVRVCQIYEGTSDVQRLVIARSL